MKLLEGAGSRAVLDLGHVALSLEGVLTTPTTVPICLGAAERKLPQFTVVIMVCVWRRGQVRGVGMS